MLAFRGRGFFTFGKMDDKVCSAARTALHLDGAAVVLDVSLRDEQSEAGSLADGASLFGSEIGVEDPAEELGVDSRAGILNLEEEARRMSRLKQPPCLQCDGSIGGSELDGIGEEIQDDLSDLFLIHWE